VTGKRDVVTHRYDNEGEGFGNEERHWVWTVCQKKPVYVIRDLHKSPTKPTRPTKETNKSDRKKRPTKETGKRDLDKRVKDEVTHRYEDEGKDLSNDERLCVWRVCQKRSVQVKRNLQKRPNWVTDTRMRARVSVMTSVCVWTICQKRSVHVKRDLQKRPKWLTDKRMRASVSVMTSVFVVSPNSELSVTAWNNTEIHAYTWI